ncbi:hypothetical protein JCGZ_01242 [Jatropha curcas]|uniref:BHLH domain-containing protein n=1 Tax=Jatropha curcas TaxID=180498 RepID=A0A067L8N7_JATCU|nr:transcription factor bHLH51 [Jatropha curcas]KDP44742.1 hypothetical protein JCGZ_01242 [Jatropha curcas]
MENHYSSSSSCRPATLPCAEPNYSSESLLLPWPLPYDHNASDSTTFQVNNGFPSSWSTPIQETGHEFSSWSNSIQIHETAEEKAASVSKSHSQAEKRRRDRINAQLSILRKLIPKSDKMDKAALLGSVIDHVKDLKGKATEVSKNITIPTEFDEVTVDIDESADGNSKDKNIFIRASVCCEDRPEVFSELIRVLKGLKLSIVRADIASVGGRVKNMLLLCNKDYKEGKVVSVSTIKQALNVFLSRISSSSMPSNYRIRSKRQRFFLPSHN